MELQMLAMITNFYLGVLFIIVGVRLTKKYFENRLLETLLLAVFFDLTGLTGLIIGSAEAILGISRSAFPIYLEIIIDFLAIVYVLVLLLFAIVLLEDKRFTVTYLLILVLAVLFGYLVKDPIILRMGIILTVFIGVAVVMFYIFMINKSIKALTFSIGLILLGISISIVSIEALLLTSYIFGILGITVIFIGQMITPARKRKSEQWIERISKKAEIR